MHVFLPEYVGIALKMCEMGATDAQLAAAFQVNVGTIREWQNKYSEFAEACRIGGDLADEKVKRALYNRAVGYDYEAVKIFKPKGEYPTIVDYTEHVPPDLTAIQYWLNNRRPDEWASKSKTEVTGKDGESLKPEIDLSKLPDELLEALAEHVKNDEHKPSASSE